MDLPPLFGGIEVKSIIIIKGCTFVWCINCRYVTYSLLCVGLYFYVIEQSYCLCIFLDKEYTSKHNTSIEILWPYLGLGESISLLYLSKSSICGPKYAPLNMLHFVTFLWISAALVSSCLMFLYDLLWASFLDVTMLTWLATTFKHEDIWGTYNLLLLYGKLTLLWMSGWCLTFLGCIFIIHLDLITFFLLGIWLCTFSHLIVTLGL